MTGALRDPERRVKGAWFVLVACLIGWPVSALTVFAGEPQAVMGLSWIALILTALNIVATTDVRREQGGEEEGRPDPSNR